ncbi:MAG: FHA domain-containing protein [Alcanivoracaceae bacterium]|nr:FHA domain-containing protein [Alcanivoracaceae bacterium]
MATLLNTKSNKMTLLRSQHIFGRHSGSSNSLLDNPEASRLHASILWNGSCWLLQDTSSNGTFINNKAIIAGVKRRLKIGDTIRFGALNAYPWVFNSDDAPKSMLVPIESSSAPPVELEGIVVLPNDNSPEITLYQAQDSEWVCETELGIIKLEAGLKISTKNSSWYFVNADTFDSTKKAEQTHSNISAPINLSFTVSKNEEHVSLCILFNNHPIDLGERTHHYLLLILARKRMTDNQSGIDDSEQGWIDKSLLSQQTGLDENYINIQIYRFRKQLIKVIPSAMQLIQIIERRRGELRFALKSVEINGGNDLMKLK